MLEASERRIRRERFNTEKQRIEDELRRPTLLLRYSSVSLFLRVDSVDSVPSVPVSSVPFVPNNGPSFTV
jgi:hypothetical protein